MIRAVIIILLGLTVSCGTARRASGPVAANYFSGEFVYFADAANFFDCATGERYPVSMQGEYAAAEREYMELDPEHGEKIPIVFRGHIEYLPAMENGAREKTIIIDSFGKFDRSYKCPDKYYLPGVYQSETEGIRSILRMRIDRTFTETVYAEDGSETVHDGTWGMASELELALDYNLSDGEKQALFEYIPDRETLATASDKKNRKALTYKKIYL